MNGDDWNPGGGPRHSSGETKCMDCGTVVPSPEDSSPCGAHPRTPEFYLCFLDFETTGLDPDAHSPIEVAALVTDDQLTELGRFESLIVPSPWGLWDPFCVELHTKTGLKTIAEAHGQRVEAVSVQLSKFLSEVVPVGAQLHLAGNSVHFDRGFLRRYFPVLERRFHHRHLDVSSVRLAAEVFTEAPSLGGEKPHRAMADVLRSIEELRHWRAVLGA